MENDNEVKYAGFWVRLLAFIVDIFVVSFLMSVMSKIGSMEKFPIIVILILWLYFTISINRWGTTIGGKFLGIRIYTEEMNNLSFLKASVRVIVSIMPFILYQYLRGMQHMMSPAPSPDVQMLPQLIFILLPFIMFFTKKRQMLHDIVAKSVVIDVNKKVQIDETSPNKILYRGRMVIRIIGVVLFLIVGGYVLLYTSVFYMLGKQSSNSYNNSFHIKYETKDYNNTKIIFYKKELELYSKEFIEAEGMYEIFESDVKKDLALGCIRYFIKREGSDNWLDEGATHRVSARNMYANTEDKIKKAKKKSDYMGHHFYTFDLNMVNHIEDEITQVWSDKNDSICENKLPANELYEIFIKKYIPKFDDENIHSRFGSKPQQREIDWYALLKNKRNDIFQKIQQEKEKIKKEEKRAEEERIYMIKKKREQRKIAQYKAEQENRTILLTLQDILFQQDKDLGKINLLLNKVQNINLWIDGSPQNNLLYQAVQHNDLNASKILLEGGASTVRTTKIIPLAVSDRVNRELFELILRDYLKPKNYSNINMLLIWAIEQKASDEKIQMILNHMERATKEYAYVIESAIKYCRDAKSIKLLLAKEETLKQNERFFKFLNETSSRCSHKKDIYELFQHKAIEKEHLKSKFIRFKK